MPKKKEEENNLLDELGELDKPAPKEEDLDPPAEPELSIVDQFVAGDLDAVKQTIQDQVIKSVSDVVNGEPVVDPPAEPE